MVCRRMRQGIILGMMLLLLSGCNTTADISPNILKIDDLGRLGKPHQHTYWQSTDAPFVYQFYTHILALPLSNGNLCPPRGFDPPTDFTFYHNSLVIAQGQWDCTGVTITINNVFHFYEPDAQFYATLQKITGAPYVGP